MAGTLIVTACYVLLNAGYLYVLPLSDVASSTRVAAEATGRILGPRAGGAIALLVVFSALGALNGIILAGPRVYYAMARDGLTFRWMGAVHPRFQTPHLAIVAQALCSAVLVATNRYRDLFNRVVFGGPSANVNSPGSFGLISSQANTPRIIQLALKVVF